MYLFAKYLAYFHIPLPISLFFGGGRGGEEKENATLGHHLWKSGVGKGDTDKGGKKEK